jgi:hypothetical protein
VPAFAATVPLLSNGSPNEVTPVLPSFRIVPSFTSRPRFAELPVGQHVSDTSASVSISSTPSFSNVENGAAAVRSRNNPPPVHVDVADD